MGLDLIQVAILILVRAGATRSRVGLHYQLPTLFGLTALNLQRIRGLSAASDSGGRFGSFPRMSPSVPPVTPLLYTCLYIPAHLS